MTKAISGGLKPGRPAQFKVDDIVVLQSNDEPFANYKIEKVFRESGEQKYWARANGNPRCFPESELGNIDHVLDDLLVYAEVKSSPNNRNELWKALRLARSSIVSEQPVPARLLKKLQNSIEKASSLLAESLKYNSAIGAQEHQDGDGVVSIIHVHVLGTAKGMPVEPSGELMVAVKIQQLLKAWHDRIKKGPRNKKQRPPKEYKTYIIYCAKDFFCRHSEREPSSDTRNPFFMFATEFYRRVTGIKDGPGLADRIDQVLSADYDPSRS